MTKKEKVAALKEVETKLDKQFSAESGKTLQKIGDKVYQAIPSFPTNLPSLDFDVLGCGGFPRGRVIEVFGPESSGKTAATLHLIGQVQKADGVAAFIDAEHSLDPTFAHKLGVNVDELVVSQPDYGEQALEIVEALVNSQAVDVIVVDSVAALVPKAELEGDMGDSHMGLQARLMSQAMRKLVGLCSKKGVTVIFINQIREKVGLVFGSPEVTTGGRALKFFASVRLEARRVSGAAGELKDGTKIVGHKVRFKAVKNKVSAPKRECEICLYYDTGFDMNEDLLKYAKDAGLVQGAAWLTLKSDGFNQKYRKEDLFSSENIGKLSELVKNYRDELTTQTTLEGTDAETIEDTET